MRRLVLLGTLLIFFPISWACGKAYDGNHILPHYAVGFSVEYLEDGCKRVVDGAGRTLLLVPRGKRLRSGYENVQKIEIPVKRVVMCSTPLASLLRALGELDSIVGVNTEKDRWYIDEVVRGTEK